MGRTTAVAVIGAAVAVAAGIAVAVPAVAEGVATAAAGPVEVVGAGYGHGAQGDEAGGWGAGGATDNHEDCDESGAVAGNGVGRGAAAGQGDEDCEACSAEPGSGDLTELGDLGTADLLTWVEEEKVAYDLYTAFATAYGTRPFDRIAASEAKHMEAVRDLLATYGLEDPTVGAAAGEFTDPDLQSLYDTLLAQGEVSETEALAVGRAVELDDIALLEKALDDVSAADVEQVLTQQLSASRRHLAAFSR